MGLSKRERAMCLFNVEILRVKVEDAKAVLDSDEDAGDVSVSSTVVSEPTTPAKKLIVEQEAAPQMSELSKKAPLVSFDDEDDGLQLNLAKPKKEKRKDREKEKDGERKKKKRKETKAEKADDDDSMWVEAPAPEIVQHFDGSNEKPTDDVDGNASAMSRGRKRAVDFM